MSCSRVINPKIIMHDSCEAHNCHTSTSLSGYPPVSGKHANHLSAGMACINCHYDYDNNALHKNQIVDINTSREIVIFRNENNQSKWNGATSTCSDLGCHVDTEWYGNDTATCLFCHGEKTYIDIRALNGSGEYGRHIKHQYLPCEKCHNDYENKSSHRDGILNTDDPAVNIVFFSNKNFSGSWINDTGPESGSCISLNCHKDATLEWYDNSTLAVTTCSNCHNESIITIRSILGIDELNSFNRHITHDNLPCEKCHYGYENKPSHRDGNLSTDDPAIDIVSFNNRNSLGSWINDTGLESGSCISLNCHKDDTLEWYGNSTWALPTCSYCHSEPINTIRSVLGSEGDFGENTSILSKHITTGSDPTEEQCRVCHSMTSHMSGYVNFRQADTNETITFDRNNSISLEPFCLSCHDSNGATATYISGGSSMSPFNDGSALGTPPYPYSANIANSWSKSYGHGTNQSHQPGSRLTCMGSGEPGTGCHGNNGTINAHGSVNEVILTKKFSYSASSIYYDETWYTLCFDCHSNYPGITKEDTFGVKQDGRFDRRYGRLISNPDDIYKKYYPPYYTSGITTRFADHNSVSTVVGPGIKTILYAGGYIWAVCSGDQKVYKIDPLTTEVNATINVGEVPGEQRGITFDGSNIWVTNHGDNTLTKINASNNTPQTVDAGPDDYPQGITYANGYIWYATNHYIMKMDPVSNTIVDSIRYTDDWRTGRARSLAFDGTYLWTTDIQRKLLVKINPATLNIENNITIDINLMPITYAAGYLWVPSSGTCKLYKVNPLIGTVENIITVEKYPTQAEYDGSNLWVGNLDNIVQKIDIILNTVITSVDVSAKAIGLAFDGTYIWVGESETRDSGPNSVSRIDVTNNILSGDPYGVNDIPSHTNAAKPDMNLHWFHMRFLTNFRGTGNPIPDWSTWQRIPPFMCGNCHRNEDATEPNTSCVNCHNVHGSNTPYGAVYDEMGYVNVSGPWGTYGKLPDNIHLDKSDPDYLDLNAFPTYCVYNCHNEAGNGEYLDLKGYNKSWFSPIED
ncbi:hypothetical protein ACFL20_07240 [Spirochaetota bacterium]